MNKGKQRLLAYIFGVVFLAIAVGYAFLRPNAQPFEEFVIRVVMAAAAAGVAATIDGFLEVKFGRFVRAGGAIAVFLLIYFVNPPPIPG